MLYGVWTRRNMKHVLGRAKILTQKGALLGHAHTCPRSISSTSFAFELATSVTFNSFNTHTHTHLTALFPGLPGWAGTRKVKPIWILLKQETVSGRTVSGSGISWAICKTARSSRQITMPAPRHSVFYRQDALPAAQPTASKHWRRSLIVWICCQNCFKLKLQTASATF